MTDILTADAPVVAETARPDIQPRWTPPEMQRFKTFKQALFGTSSLVNITYYAG